MTTLPLARPCTVARFLLRPLQKAVIYTALIVCLYYVITVFAPGADSAPFQTDWTFHAKTSAEVRS